MENVTYMTYEGKARIDGSIIIVSMWNTYLESEGQDALKVSLNDKEFFSKNFKNPYDAAMAVQLSGNWRWTDGFAYFNDEGYLTSFSRLDDETCPIDFDKIDIGYLIRGLQDLQEEGEKSPHKKRYVVDNIPKAIHDALQE